MKTMKFFAMALAAVTMFASCKKDDGGVEANDLQLLVKIAPVKLDNTKATGPEDMAKAEQADFTDGVIFLCDAAGKVEQIVDIVKTQVKGAGQDVGKVKSTDLVYVVANVPATIIGDWNTELGKPTGLTIGQINNTVVNTIYGDAFGKDYLQATLANSDGNGVGVQATSGTAAVADVALSPVYTRLELHKIHSKVTTQGTDEVTSFKVKGVYLDGYFKNYTVGASGTEPQSMDKNIANALPEMSIIHASTGWASTAQAPFEAIVDAGEPTKIWGHNLPTGAAPKLVIELTDVVGFIGGNAIQTTDTYYLTVRTYKDGATPVDIFSRGHVYRIQDLEFEAKHLGTTPNSADVDLTVRVSINAWELKNLTGGME